MEYGPAPEDPKESLQWLDTHKRRFGHFIGGAWKAPADGRYFETADPSNGERIAEVAQGSAPARQQPLQTPHLPPVMPPHSSGPPPHPVRKWLTFTGGALGVAVAAWFMVPWLIILLNTVSTDDAYVNGHVTFVAPRVLGQVTEVLVDDNDRVKKGDVLVRLDGNLFEGGRRSFDAGEICRGDEVESSGDRSVDALCVGVGHERCSIRERCTESDARLPCHAAARAGT